MNDRERMLQEMEIWNSNLKVDVFPGDLQDLADRLIEAGFGKVKSEYDEWQDDLVKKMKPWCRGGVI